MSDPIAKGQNTVLGHATRLLDDTPVHLRQVMLSLSRPPDPTWNLEAPTRRSRAKWVDYDTPVAHLWR